MNQDCWAIWPDRGFLMHPDPLISAKLALDGVIAADAIDHVEAVAADLPALMVSGRVHSTLDRLPLFDYEPLLREADRVDFRAIERLMQVYSYFASAFVHADIHAPQHRLPAGVAVPLVQLAHLVDRPPILSYANYVLSNWRRPLHADSIEVDSLRQIQHFLGTRDESWFVLIHVEIERHGAQALAGLQDAAAAADVHDTAGLEHALGRISDGLERMITTFRRMPEQCDSTVYYETVRPYIFSFEEVVYEGVAEFDGQPMHFRGQTGAQSTIVPALVAGLGLRHEESSLTQHLMIMRDYMPTPHREFAARMASARIRETVSEHAGNAALVDSYNHTLRQLIRFRSLHYHYATEYIFKKVANPVGTGGTIFMDWLKQLIAESEAQFLTTTAQTEGAPSS